MPRLPPSPNLEHLKNQAKQLLKAQRSGEPEAQGRFYAQGVRTETVRLADAQWVVAREYGFPDWARLKRFVEAAAEPQPPQNTPSRKVSARQHVVLDLTGYLVTDAGRDDVAALGERFAVMPLWTILTVRGRLLETGDFDAVIDGLVRGLEHPEPRVRFNCAGALDHMADERAAGPLRRRLNDPVPRVRRAALHSLSCDACKLNPLPQPGDLVPRLIDLALSDPSVRVRRSAVPVLEGYCGDARVVRALQGLALDADGAVSRNARHTLRRLGKSYTAP